MVLTYTNPVWAGYLADPFIMKVGREYFALGTGGPHNRGRQPDGKMFPLLRSEDLVHWEHLGGALKPLDDPDRPACWAPEVAERDGIFYLYYSAGGLEGENQQLRVGVADSPAGPYVDSGSLLLPDESFSIDPHPFRDPIDGLWYLYFARDYIDDGRCGTGTAVVRLKDDMLGVVGPITTVIRATADWQIFQRNRRWYGRDWEAWHTVEGPFVLFHEGSYFCLYSGGRWETADYGVAFGVADSPLGPWVDEMHSEGPSVLKGTDTTLGPGHCSVVIGPDDRTPFLVYHAWDVGRTARRMCIDPLLWTPDGPRCDGPSSSGRSLSLQEG